MLDIVVTLGNELSHNYSLMLKIGRRALHVRLMYVVDSRDTMVQILGRVLVCGRGRYCVIWSMCASRLLKSWSMVKFCNIVLSRSLANLC